MKNSNTIPANWNEARYLDQYPDVDALIRQGKVASGYEHYLFYGLLEGRLPSWYRIDDDVWPWSNEAYTESNPEVGRQLLELELSPMEHYKQIGRPAGLVTGLEHLRVAIAQACRLPEWAVEEMSRASFVEPGLDLDRFPNAPIYNPFACAEFAGGLRVAAETLRHNKYDLIFFVPWLKTGGGDLVALWHIRAAASCYERVAVFTTENAHSEWLSRIPQTVDVAYLGDVMPNDDGLRALVCYHLICALKPTAVHIINSHAAWCLLTRHPHAVAGVTRVFVSLFCYDYSVHGEPVGYARNIRRCADSVAMIFTDNSIMRDHLVNDIGMNPDRVWALRYPIRDTHVSMLPPDPACNRVLWASRLDRQKQPAIVTQIAAQLPGLSFDVYGSGVLESNGDIISRFVACPNITYRGGFDTVQNLLGTPYRCFLYTSLWDGLPNVVLEMMFAGMLVIAPKIGGIGADLGDEHLILVDDPADVRGYVEALRWIYKNTQLAEAIRLRGQAFVREHHEPRQFEDALQAAGYLTHSIGHSAVALKENDIESPYLPVGFES